MDNPSDNELTVMYSLNQGQQWKKYQGDLSIRENKTVQFKTVDAYGNQSQVVTVVVNEFSPVQKDQTVVTSPRPLRPVNKVSWPTPNRHRSQDQRNHYRSHHSPYFSAAGMSHHGRDSFGPKMGWGNFNQNGGWENWKSICSRKQSMLGTKIFINLTGASVPCTSIANDGKNKRRWWIKTYLKAI